MIRAKIDVTKIDKAHLYKGQKGTYLDITLLENRDGIDQYGNSHMIVQDIGQAARESGERGAILGNAKTFGPTPTAGAAPPPAQLPPVAEDPELDPIPF